MLWKLDSYVPLKISDNKAAFPIQDIIVANWKRNKHFKYIKNLWYKQEYVGVTSMYMYVSAKTSVHWGDSEKAK